MAVTAKSNVTKEDYEKLGRAIEAALIDDYIDLLGNTKRQLWGSFTRGLIGGFAAVLGATVLVAIVVFILHSLGGLPVVGQYLQNAGNTIQK
jgi:hypothetical protein